MAPDYRNDKMLTAEGLGIAADRYEQFCDDELDGLVDDAEKIGFKPAHPPLHELDADIRDDIATRAREESELIGFWIAWHSAGGFRQLEASGWHRATIYRKTRDFRDTFKVHPDEATFEWITLDLRPLWRQRVLDTISHAYGGDPPPDDDPLPDDYP